MLINKIKVKEVMLQVDQITVVNENQYLKEALVMMTKFSVGIVCVVDNEYLLKGVMTDGDIRRMVLNDQKPLPSLFLDDTIDHSNTEFKFVKENDVIADALNIIDKNEIWDLPVTNNEGLLKGLIHLHPIVKKLSEK